MAYNGVEGVATLGLATGGTWEPSRYALGMPDFLRSIYGMVLPADKIAGVGTLDDYAYPTAVYKMMEGTIGKENDFIINKRLPWSYRMEQLTWLRRIGIDDSLFVSPPLEFMGSFSQAAGGFRQELDNEIRPTLVQYHGIGTIGHDAFNEPPCNPRTAQTRFELISDLTKFQNGFAFLRQGEILSPMFRNIGGTYELITSQEIIAKCRELAAKYDGTRPPELDYIEPGDFEYFARNLEQTWSAAKNIVGRMPSGAFTQGVGDLRESCGVPTSALDLVLANGGHKRNAVTHTIEGDLNERWPASAFQAFRNAIIIVEETAAKHLKHRDQYFTFEPDDRTARDILLFDAARIENMFWDLKAQEHNEQKLQYKVLEERIRALKAK
jgi:6-phosphogluconolactonase/glucosamine-6-phosphate isomerase/deaminase